MLIVKERLKWGISVLNINDGVHFGGWVKVGLKPFEICSEIMFWKWAVTLGRTYHYEEVEDER